MNRESNQANYGLPVHIKPWRKVKTKCGINTNKAKAISWVEHGQEHAMLPTTPWCPICRQ